tara:strand:+ start:6491 stop:8644 length:2154 start_codon:yes stop_codon:yes gene_type:complete
VQHRHRVTIPLTYCLLALILIIGASLRVIEIKNNFGVNNGFESYLNVASHFWTQPGGSGPGYTQEREDYIFTLRPVEPATGSAIASEKGWAFILSLIIPEGTRGLSNIENIVVSYQFVIDLTVLVCLFFVGKALGGPLGGIFAALAYALFRPAMSHMSWVSYYYWAYFFSAVSLLFWTVIYRPEVRITSLRVGAACFFLYGCFMGFACFVRLVFLLVPLVLSPMIFFRERSFKRAGVFLMFMLLGQGLFLIPQVLITKKYFGEYSLSTRAKWMSALYGVGAYPNPFGIRDSGEISLNEWSIEQGGPDMNKVGQAKWDEFMKVKTLQFIKERPDIFWKNFKTNFLDGIKSKTIGGVRYSGSTSPHWLGIPQKHITLLHQFLNWYAWIIIALTGILYFIAYNRAGPFISVIIQGLYLLGSVCLILNPIDTHITGFFCVYVLLISLIATYTIRGLIALPEGCLRCWLWNRNLNQLAPTIAECFDEDWDTQNPKKSPSNFLSKNKQYLIKTLVTGLVVLFFFLISQLDYAMKKKWADDVFREPTNEEIQRINSILNTKILGGFENWDPEAPMPLISYEDHVKHVIPRWVSTKGEPEARIRRTSDPDEFRSGKAGVVIQTGPKGVSTNIHFNITPDRLYKILEKDMIMEVWVKSNTKTSETLKLQVQGISSFYQNSGNWEKLKVQFKIAAKISPYITIHISAHSPNSQFFIDDATLRYAGKN